MGSGDHVWLHSTEICVGSFGSFGCQTLCVKSYVLFAKMITNILWHTATRAVMFVLMVGLERSRGRHLSAAAVSFQSWHCMALALDFGFDFTVANLGDIFTPRFEESGWKVVEATSHTRERNKQIEHRAQSTKQNTIHEGHKASGSTRHHYL